MLLNEFPRLRQQYNEDRDYLEDLPHLTFENIFVPFVKEALEGDKEKNEISRVFELIEKMINCSDERVQEVAVVSVLEALVYEREMVMKIKSYLGTKSLEAFKKMEKEFGWLD